MPYDNILANVIPHLSAWWNYIIILFYVFGFGFFVHAWIRYPNDKQSGAITRAMISAGVGVLLLNTPPFLDALAYTVFNQGSIQTLSYTPPAHEAQTYVQFAVYMIAIVGLIGIGRGLVLLKASATEANQFGRALIHIFGGILCVNLVDVLRVFGVTLGGDVQSVVQAIVG